MGFSSIDTQKKVLLDNFSCSGLMVSAPGKMRSCTGPILFTMTRGLFLKKTCRDGQEKSEILDSTSPGDRAPLSKASGDFIPLLSFPTPF